MKEKTAVNITDEDCLREYDVLLSESLRNE